MALGPNTYIEWLKIAKIEMCTERKHRMTKLRHGNESVCLVRPYLNG